METLYLFGPLYIIFGGIVWWNITERNNYKLLFGCFIFWPFS